MGKEVLKGKKGMGEGKERGEKRRGKEMREFQEEEEGRGHI